MFRPAYSLVYALIYMVVILLVAVSAFENVEGKRLHYQDIEHAAQVKMNARSAMESGFRAIKTHELGYETSGARLYLQTEAPGDWDIYSDPTQTGYEQCVPSALTQIGDGCSKWKVTARQQVNTFVPDGGAASDLLYTPIPNTGDAWTDTVCIKHFEVPRNPDHPCNFNKIRYGEAVSIPLYYTNENGATVTPFEGSTADFYLRLRTPCKPIDGRPVAECDQSERYELDDGGVSQNKTLAGNDGIILWSLIGTDILENTCTDATDFSTCEKDEETLFVSVDKVDVVTVFGTNSERANLNTEITEFMVNNGEGAYSYNFLDHTVLSTDTSSTPFNTDGYRSISDFVHESSQNFDLLSLRIEVTSPLLNADAFSDSRFVPYLEWQLVSDLSPSEALASDQVLITGYGYEKGSKGVYAYPFRRTWDRIRELIPNFTIAN